MTAVPVLATYDIGIPFLGWPIAGSQQYNNIPHLAFYGPPGYNPLACTPPATPNNKDAFATPAVDTNYSYADVQESVIDPQNKKNWQLNVGGSARPGPLLAGRQYWEVEILSLPTAVPDNWTNPNINPPWSEFDFLPNFPIGPHNAKGTSVWLTSLNSFLNPVIGLWPKDPKFNQHTIIGLDDPTAQYRSIGVTRSN